MMREYLMEILNGPMSIFKHLSRVIKSIVILSMNLLFLLIPFPSYFDNPKQSRRENRLKEWEEYMQRLEFISTE